MEIYAEWIFLITTSHTTLLLTYWQHWLVFTVDPRTVPKVSLLPFLYLQKYNLHVTHTYEQTMYTTANMSLTCGNP